MTATKQTDDRRSLKERSKHAISLENFGQKKGQVRALEEFRLRKQKKRIETAKVLRKYKKSMKSEGYEAGKGAARKRVSEVPDHDAKVEEPSNDVGSTRRKKTNPFQKSLDRARQKKEETEERAKQKEENQKEKERKLRERKRQSKLLAKRTRRGQPIMKHTVECMLKKLERQNSAAAAAASSSSSK